MHLRLLAAVRLRLPLSRKGYFLIAR